VEVADEDASLLSEDASLLSEVASCHEVTLRQQLLIASYLSLIPIVTILL